MQVRENSKREIEERLKTMGDYVKMDYLSSCLKSNLDFEARKFVLNTLAVIYESRGMHSEAGRMARNSADINVTFEGKIKDFIKSMELFIKAGIFDEADNVFNKALVLANHNQKIEIKAKRKEIYFGQAQEFLKKDKRKHALDTYEKILTLELNDMEKKWAQNALLDLYEKLGRVKEYYALKKIN